MHLPIMLPDCKEGELNSSATLLDEKYVYQTIERNSIANYGDISGPDISLGQFIRLEKVVGGFFLI